jgi:DNA repair protein RecO (recombination protein O)
MPQTTQGIILQQTRYRDKQSILRIYTLQHGLQSYAVNIGRSRSAKIKPAHVAPLNQVEFVEHTRKLREIQLISEMRVTYVYQELPTDIVKSCLAAFINEVLIKCLKEHQPNEELYFFLQVKLKSLDQGKRSVANYHLYFLLGLSNYLGFYPNNNYSEKNCLFDLQEGVFIAAPPEHLFYSDSEVSFRLSELIRACEGSREFACDSHTRGELLKLLLLFYKLHVPGFGDLRSLPVLREVLAD